MADSPPQPATPGDKESPAAFRRSLSSTVWIAGVFSALILAVLLWKHFTATASDPWKSPQLIALKNQLGEQPKNESLKVQIRQSDMDFRRLFRRRLGMDQLGGWLLVGGVVLLAATARKTGALGRVPFLPKLAKGGAEGKAPGPTRAIWSVAAVGGVVGLGLAGVAFAIGTSLPVNDTGWRKLAGKEEEISTAPLPDAAALAANWPRFRGWDGSGATAQTNYALTWDGKTGRGIEWKAAIPQPGHNSPIVWSNQVFITGGTAEKREVLSYDATTGRLLWERAVENVPGSPAKMPGVPDETGFAASTAATDGRKVYAIFANGDLAAVNFDGAIAWSKALGPMKNTYGHASSLTTWQGKLIVQLDQGESGATDSKLMLLDGATGRSVWSQSRPVPVSWATPIVIEAAGKQQIITFALPWVMANTFSDGSELWRADLLENEVVPSPIFAGGMIVAVSPSSKIVAVHPDGAGDVTKSQVAWTNEDNVPDITCPVSNGELVFTATSGGVLTCIDLKTGAKVWQYECNLDVRASPSLVGDRLFVLSQNGTGLVVEAGREFKEIARSELPDKFLASPAFANGRIYLRGATNLYCLGPGNTQLAKER